MMYEIVTHKTMWGLEQLVTRRLQAGWKLQGGVSFDAHSLVYMQAMVYDFDETRDNQTAEARVPEGDPCVAYAAARAASI